MGKCTGKMKHVQKNDRKPPATATSSKQHGETPESAGEEEDLQETDSKSSAGSPVGFNAVNVLTRVRRLLWNFRCPYLSGLVRGVRR